MTHHPLLIRRWVFVLGLLVSVALAPGLVGQTAPLWGALEPGSSEVGFQTIEQRDQSRVAVPKRDYFGAVIPGERARSIQASVWYPAKASVDALPMVYGEYVFPNPKDTSFIQFATAVQQRDLGVLAFAFQGDQALVLESQNLPMKATRELEPAEGTFPLVLYCPDVNGSYSDNLVLCEYLASHGFVVVTVHPYGSDGQPMTGTQKDIETLARDLEYGMALARTLPFVDGDRLAVVGTRFGGLVARVLQMRNSDIDVLVDWNGWGLQTERAGGLTANDFFEVRRASVPQLAIIADTAEGYNLVVLDSCRYAERTLVKLAGIPPDGFRSYHAIRDAMNYDAPEGTSVLYPGYQLCCEYTQRFLARHLQRDSTAAAWLAMAPGGTVMAAQDLPPTVNQWFAIINQRGALEAVTIYERFNTEEPGSLVIPEINLNAVGYQLLQSGRSEEAVAVFRIMADAYPTSANSWDSYADGLQAIGDTARIALCYEKVLEVLPNDVNVNEQLRATLRANAEQGLARFRRTGSQK